MKWYVAPLQGNDYILQVMEITRFRSWEGYKAQSGNISFNSSLNQSKKKNVYQCKWNGVATSKEKLAVKNEAILGLQTHAF